MRSGPSRGMQETKVEAASLMSRRATRSARVSFKDENALGACSLGAFADRVVHASGIALGTPIPLALISRQLGQASGAQLACVLPRVEFHPWLYDGFACLLVSLVQGFFLLSACDPSNLRDSGRS